MLTVIPAPASIVKRTELYGCFANRFISFLVDTTIIMFWYSLLLYSTTSNPDQLLSWKGLMYDGSISTEEIAFITKSLFFNIYFPVLHWLYYTILESSPKQATIGKFTLGLKVTDLRGKRIGFVQANLRYFSKLLSAIPFCLGFLLILTTRRNQMLHDYFAKTVVVTE